MDRVSVEFGCAGMNNLLHERVDRSNIVYYDRVASGATISPKGRWMSGTLDSLLLASLASISEASLKAPYDAVVVGGGTAGITTARTLVEGGRRVALLELGPLALLTHLSSTGLRFDADLARAVQTALQFSPSLPDGTPFGALIKGVGGRGMFWNGASPRFWRKTSAVGRLGSRILKRTMPGRKRNWA